MNLLKSVIMGVMFAVGGIVLEQIGVEKHVWFALYGAIFMIVMQAFD